MSTSTGSFILGLGPAAFLCYEESGGGGIMVRRLLDQWRRDAGERMPERNSSQLLESLMLIREQMACGQVSAISCRL